MPSVTIGALTFIYQDDTLGLSQEINVSASVDFLDGQTLLNAIRQAEASDIGMGFPKIADASGKAQLSSGVFVGTTIQLLDNWRIYTLKDTGVFSIGSANIVKADGSAIFIDNPSITYIQNLAVASTQVSTSGGGSGASAVELWSYTPRSLTEKTGFSLSTAGIQAIWDALTSALTTVGSVGKRIADFVNASVNAIPTNPLLVNDSRLNNLDTTISSRMATFTYTPPDNSTIATIGTRTARVDALIVNPGSGDRFTATALSNAPSTTVDLSGINTALADIKGTSFSTSTDSLHALRSRGDAAWMTGFGSGDRTTLGNLPTATYTSALSTLQASVGNIPTVVYTSTLSVILESVQAVQGKTDQLGFTGANVNAIAIAAGGTFPTIPAASDNAASVRTNLTAELRQIIRLAKVHALTSATVTAKQDATRSTSDGDINQTITVNPDGSRTMSGSP